MSFSPYYNNEIFEHIANKKEHDLIMNICKLNFQQLSDVEQDFEDERLLNERFGGSRTDRIVKKAITLRQRQLRGHNEGSASNARSNAGSSNWFQGFTNLMLQMYISDLAVKQFHKMIGMGYDEKK